MQIDITIAGPIGAALCSAIGILWARLVTREKDLDAIQSQRVEDARADTKILHEGSTAIADVTRPLQSQRNVHSDISKIYAALQRMEGSTK